MEHLPLFDHDQNEARNPMSRPLLKWKGKEPPSRCVLSFMNDVLEEYVASHSCEVADIIHSETCDFTLYIGHDDKGGFCLIHCPVGAAPAAIIVDLLIASGVKALVSCGGCGVLRPIEQGRLLLVESALRDEGTSYHYLSPASEVQLSSDDVSKASHALDALDVPYERVRTWTSDGFFRETPALVNLRREQGYDVVDMECSALAAVCECYGAHYVALLYSGDSLINSKLHDERGWLEDMPSRKAVFYAALKVLEAF